MREDVYETVKDVDAAEKDSKTLDAEAKRLVKHTLRDLKRNGLSLPVEKRDALKALQKKLSGVCVEFSNHLNAENTRLLMTREELDGLPDDFFEGREEATDAHDGDKKKYVITLKYPDLLPIMKLAKKEATRKVFLSSMFQSE